MRLLLDAHALIWFCEGHSKLGKKARAAFEDNSNECFVSHATPWEMAIKLSLGRLELRMGLEDFFPGVLNANGFVFLESKVSHYAELARLPFHHRDPFDRLLVAQARVEEMALVTCGGFASDYGVPVLWRVFEGTAVSVRTHDPRGSWSLGVGERPSPALPIASARPPLQKISPLKISYHAP